MRNRTLKLWVIVLGVLVILVVSTSALAAPLLKKAPITDEMVVWELTKTTVVDPGQRVTTPGVGTFVENYVIEAKAKAKHNNVVPEGQLRLTLNMFSPEQDMADTGQKAGTWYVTGLWTITKKNADPDALDVKHNPEVMRGFVQSELSFNPIGSQEKWTGKAWLPMSLAVGQWGRGEGTLSMNGQMEGDLYLQIAFWPVLKVK